MASHQLPCFVFVSGLEHQSDYWGHLRLMDKELSKNHSVHVVRKYLQLFSEAGLRAGGFTGQVVETTSMKKRKNTKKQLHKAYSPFIVTVNVGNRLMTSVQQLLDGMEGEKKVLHLASGRSPVQFEAIAGHPVQLILVLERLVSCDVLYEKRISLKGLIAEPARLVEYGYTLTSFVVYEAATDTRASVCLVKREGDVERRWYWFCGADVVLISDEKALSFCSNKGSGFHVELLVYVDDSRLDEVLGGNVY
jgi:hypothetical protein